MSPQVRFAAVFLAAVTAAGLLAFWAKRPPEFTAAELRERWQQYQWRRVVVRGRADDVFPAGTGHVLRLDKPPAALCYFPPERLADFQGAVYEVRVEGTVDGLDHGAVVLRDCRRVYSR